MLTEKNLHRYQKHGVKHVIQNEAAGLFLEMGLGKTVTTLTAAAKLLDALDVSKILVIGPKRVVESVWIQEAQKWKHLKDLKFSLISGTAQKRAKALREEADIYLLGRDNVVWLCGQFGGAMLPFDMLVIDELSSFKNPQSLRFKALRGVRPSFARVVGLTGTPAPNGLIDLWAQMFLLDRGERLYKFIGHYRKEFFRPDKTNGAIVYSYKLQDKTAEERIFDKIADICISMKAEDYLDVPPRIDNFISVEFPAALRKKYDEFERDLVLELFQTDEDAITAANAAALCNKLLQFANGAVYDAERKVHELHGLKLDALDEIIEEANGAPVLVAVAFRHDMDRIKKRFKGLQPKELKTDDDIHAWNAGEIPLLLLHPASGGHGLNLQKGGNIIVWFGQNWSLELYQQLNARLHRQGQSKPVYIHHILARATFDEKVIDALQGKEQKQEMLMKAVKALVNKHK